MSGALGTWIDGAPATQVPVDDRGLQYGDGLFETVLVRRGRARFLDLHLARLARGCQRLGIPFADATLRAEISGLVPTAPELAVLKIIVTRGSAPRRGYAPTGAEQPRRILSLFAATPRPDDAVDLAIASFRIADGSPLAGLKHLNRLENVLAAREAAEKGAFDALLLAADGRVISGAMSNLLVVTGGRIVTPALEGAGVAGVMRAVVLRECAALGIAATESRLTLADLEAADEAFVTNARVGVVPVRRVGEHRFTMDGVVSRRIAGHVEALDA